MVSGFTNIAYADCFSGISGDMFLAALIDAGLPLSYLKEQLSGLDLPAVDIKTTITTEQCGIKAVRLTIKEINKGHNHRTWKSIRQLINQSELGEPVKKSAIAIFSRLAMAEAKIHNCQPEEVHFHEVGSIDSIIDIVGAAIGLDFFQIKELSSSSLPMPTGWVKCQHGTLPLPAPAVYEILRDVPVHGIELKQELITPTGAAIIKETACHYGALPAMLINKVGYGAGSNNRPDNRPNLFRLVIGKKEAVNEFQSVEIIESNLDDWSPESFPYLCDKLLNLGALDVSLAPIQMKKGRPAFAIQIIAPPDISLPLKQCLLTETSAIGLRFRLEKRMTLPRISGHVKTAWGELRVKKVETPDGPRLYPEYEGCKEIANSRNVSIKDVYAAAAACTIADFTPLETCDK